MVYTTQELATLLHEHKSIQHFPDAKMFKSLQTWLNKKEAKLEPLAEGIDAGPLQNYFQLHVNKKITDEDLAALLKLPGIDGAYDKPDDSPPR